ncbi:hypothetical protein SLS53_008183 [Cytospora paraplurivora]|uniref:Uncharacterized protein n=1 Tax=Cytospora paraplurivora TaxID=2898453 RepID=A0AAN9TZQ9_9PEZI
MDGSSPAPTLSPNAETANVKAGKTLDSEDASKPDINEDIDPANEVQGTKLVLIHLSICLCTFLVGLDFNLIATAVPVITADFNSTRDIGWYGAAFMVAMCASQPLAGKVYTLFSKKTSYLLYISVFELGSLLPIGGASAAIFFLLVHINPTANEKKPIGTRLQTLDALGLTLFAGSITMLLLALQWGGVEYGWSSSSIIGLFVGFGVVLFLFIFWSIRRGEDALVPLRLFTINRNPVIICAASFFVNGPFQVIIYWLPIWFQGILSASPVRSGINFFPTVISDVLAAFIGSGIVTQVGWWNPFLIFAEVMVCLGGGLLTTIYPNISGAYWVGYQIFGGVGYSLASNLDLVPLGSSALLTIMSTSCAIFMAIGQTVFQKQLQVNLGKVVPENVVKKIVDSGVTDVASLVDAAELPAVIEKYSLSVTQVFYIPAVAPVISFLLLLGCKWISTKCKQDPAAATDVREKTDSEQVVVI